MTEVATSNTGQPASRRFRWVHAFVLLIAEICGYQHLDGLVPSAAPEESSAICPPAADAHGLVPLAENIEDDPTNQTRFLSFTRAELAGSLRSPDASRYKTSLIVLVDHKPGMLALTLQAFGARGVNLMALQSRPERLDV